MPNPTRIYSRFDEGVDIGWSAAQVMEQTGNPITVAGSTGVTLSVYDMGNPGTALYTTSIARSSIIYDSWQLDGRWTEDDLGYNFAHYLTHASAFGVTADEGGKTYVLIYTITTTLSDDLKVIHHAYCVPAYSP